MFGLGCVSKSESSYALRVRRCVRRVIWGAVIAGLPILPSSVTCALHAQTDKTQKTDKTEKAGKSERKLIYKEVPVYPAELKSHYIGGEVRLKIGGSPRGKGDMVTPIEGNTILNGDSVATL